ncbi:MAG: serine/threonine protein kinase [Alphaproteobacteria bacterium]|nr:serine/threonine protein kinase [Alphaproteobacteria bacterium]
MKEVEGRTLSAVIDDVHRTSSEGWSTTPSGWSLRRMITVFLAACRAVAYAHEQGVVHRDLKPENLMVGRHGEVYVVDWGLARLLGAGQDARPGQIAGTPAYMSPEQARGEVDRVDERSDVYALGATLYEILSGRPPSSEPPRWCWSGSARGAHAADPARDGTGSTGGTRGGV